VSRAGATERVTPHALTPRPQPAAVEPPRRGLFHRRRNRRITVTPISAARVALWLARVVRGAARRGLVVVKGLATVAFLAGAAWGGEHAVRHVIASPRFAVREVRVGATLHVQKDEVLALAGVGVGDRLLSIDTDAVAARVASHPWVASARVRRELPSVLAIDVVERRAAAAALLGGLYLVDESGRPFKRATLDEADGLVLLTGLSREQYASWRGASEAAYREALSIVAEYHAQDPAARGSFAPGGAGWRGAGGGDAFTGAFAGAFAGARPPLSEVHIDPRYGFSLFLYEGGGEIRLGRGDYADKLGRLDEILAALGPRGPVRLRTVHLDGPSRERVPIRLADTAAAGSSPAAAPSPAAAIKVAAAAAADKKFRRAVKRGED
jgi:cell division septal protein FtsQ